jgi:hypothetical protein
MDDLISRQAVINVIDKIFPAEPMLNDYTQGITCGAALAKTYIEQLPSAQTDGIPLEWIDKHLEWLDNCDNDFAQLAKVSIKAMVEIWKKDKT